MAVDILYNPFFVDHFRPLRELSADFHDTEAPIYMTSSTLLAVDFDAVKDEYCLRFSGHHTLRSVDALLPFPDGGVMIEFKNGTLCEKNGKEIREKIAESLLIFCDRAFATISDLRESWDFVLVYNDAKNNFGRKESSHFGAAAGGVYEAIGKSVRGTAGNGTCEAGAKRDYDASGNGMSNIFYRDMRNGSNSCAATPASEDPLPYGLERFKDLCFHDVRVIAASEFDAYLDSLIVEQPPFHEFPSFIARPTDAGGGFVYDFTGLGERALC